MHGGLHPPMVIAHTTLPVWAPPPPCGGGAWALWKPLIGPIGPL